MHTHLYTKVGIMLTLGKHLTASLHYKNMLRSIKLVTSGAGTDTLLEHMS